MALDAPLPLLLPEIVQQIVSLSENQEQLHLAYTCKALFNSITPFIWEKIYGVQKIMELIPGVYIEKEYIEDENDTVTETLVHIIIDASVLGGDWARCWIYAPFVKHIAPFMSDKRCYGDNLRVHGWQFLFMGLEGKPLLPNLRSVDTGRQYLSPCFDQMAWLALFLSPSLQRFCLGDIKWNQLKANRDVDLPIRPCDFLLGVISRSPSSDPSEIRPTRAEWHPSECVLAELCSEDYRECFYWLNSMSAPVGLKYLEIRLSSLTRVLWDELYIIGCLPLLEGLHVRFAKIEYEAEHDIKKMPLPPSLFPSLQNLYLPMIPDITLFGWIWGMEPLVSGLISAQIAGWQGGFDSETLASTIIQLLHRNSPKLMDMDFDLTAPRHTGTTEMLEVACMFLSVIPLRTLVLGGQSIGYFPRTHSERTFPHLRHLRLKAKHHVAGGATFPKIAKAFPNLEHLYIDPLSDPNPYDTSDMNLEYTVLQSVKIYIPGLGPPRMWHKEKQRRFIG